MLFRSLSIDEQLEKEFAKTKENGLKNIDKSEDLPEIDTDEVKETATALENQNDNQDSSPITAEVSKTTEDKVEAEETYNAKDSKVNSKDAPAESKTELESKAETKTKTKAKTKTKTKAETKTKTKAETKTKTKAGTKTKTKAKS